MRAEVRIPDRTESGPATVNLVGDDSEFVAGVDLQVAAASAPAGDDDGAGTLVPLVAAAAALVATVAGFVSVAGRQRTTAGRRRPLNGSA